jgi:hypothetical protein
VMVAVISIAGHYLYYSLCFYFFCRQLFFNAFAEIYLH